MGRTVKPMARKVVLGIVGNAGLGVLRKPPGARSPKCRYRKINNIPMHRVIVEHRTGIKLKPHQPIHHFDPNDKLTNEGTLVVCENAEYHALLERRQRAYFACGHADWRKCHYCNSWDDPKNMREMKPTTRFTSSRFYHHQFKAQCVDASDPRLLLKKERKTAKHVQHLPPGVSGRKHQRPDPLWKHKRKQTFKHADAND